MYGRFLRGRFLHLMTRRVARDTLGKAGGGECQRTHHDNGLKVHSVSSSGIGVNTTSLIGQPFRELIISARDDARIATAAHVLTPIEAIYRLKCPDVTQRVA